MLKINFGKQELKIKLAASKFELYLSPNHKNRPGLIFTFYLIDRLYIRCYGQRLRLLMTFLMRFYIRVHYIVHTVF